MKRLFTLLGLFAVGVCSFAHTFIAEGLTYCVLSEEEKTVEVIDGRNVVGEVFVPETVVYNDRVRYKVAKVGSYAFQGNNNISAVYLPSVTTIDQLAFADCGNLSSIYMPAVTSIGALAFGSCYEISTVGIGSIEQWCNVNFKGDGSSPLDDASSNVYLYRYIEGSYNGYEPIFRIDIPNTVTVIPDGAFKHAYIYSVSAPLVTSIGRSAFESCKELTSLDFPSATSIGERAFEYCLSLTSANFPAVTSIGSYAFKNCSSLTSVVFPVAPSIGSNAFESCKSLTSLDFPAATSIGSDAFEYCQSLISVNFPAVTSIGNRAFSACQSLTTVVFPVATSIGSDAFSSCYHLSSVNIPAVTSIGSGAFATCLNLTSLHLPEVVESIGSRAFYNCSKLSEIFFRGSTPANITGNDCFPSKTCLIVPDDAYDAYTNAWPSYKSQLAKESKREMEINVVAQDAESAIHRAVGEENLRHVKSLKVNGSINSYDIMILRNKMVDLQYLDLSNATIVGSNYEYYTGYHTTDNEIGPYSFYNLQNLISVKLPEVTAIQKYAFSGCSNLREINLPESLTTLADHAFYECKSLPSIEIPGSVGTIGSYAFYGCSVLNTLTLNEGLNEIGNYAFSSCKITDIRFPESLTTIRDFAFRYNTFEEINLPPNLNTIGQYAFQGCSKLLIVRLNPMLKNISNYAFTDCDALKKVYTYTLEPTDILQNTYSAYKTADLYVPTPSYYTYYYNTQWSQFLSVNKSDEEYDFKSFYITKDYEMDDNTGILGGDPDAELNENSGLINSGSETQELGTVTIRFNGNNGSASIIANGNLTAEKIKVEITVTGNKWHFFCFPFDVPLTGVSTSGNKAYVFRHYNAEKRATGGSGWENLPADQEVLKAGEGYIFQANGNTTLTVEVDNKTTFLGENVAAALKVQDAANVANASWNFKGNPGYAYFDIDDLGFSAPITVWDPSANNYVALRPGDDDAFLHPFQAFFVQKPEGTDALTFNAENRSTYLGSQKKMAKKVAQRRAASTADNPRKLVNLTLTDGQTTDKTRVVFNDEKSMAYEMDCDAAKFASNGVPQLYSIDSNNTHYAINERPYGDGTVRLGFTAEKDGTFSIEAARMDTPCYLRDLELNITHDLSVGSYDFQSKKGVHEARFVLVNTKAADDATGVESINLNDIAEDAVIYDLQGRQVKRAQHGVYIINGKKLNVK